MVASFKWLQYLPTLCGLESPYASGPQNTVRVRLLYSVSLSDYGSDVLCTERRSSRYIRCLQFIAGCAATTELQPRRTSFPLTAPPNSARRDYALRHSQTLPA